MMYKLAFVAVTLLVLLSSFDNVSAFSVSDSNKKDFTFNKISGDSSYIIDGQVSYQNNKLTSILELRTSFNTTPPHLPSVSYVGLSAGVNLGSSVKFYALNSGSWNDITHLVSYMSFKEIGGKTYDHIYYYNFAVLPNYWTKKIKIEITTTLQQVRNYVSSDNNLIIYFGEGSSVLKVTGTGSSDRIISNDFYELTWNYDGCAYNSLKDDDGTELIKGGNSWAGLGTSAAAFFGFSISDKVTTDLIRTDVLYRASCGSVNDSVIITCFSDSGYCMIENSVTSGNGDYKQQENIFGPDIMHYGIYGTRPVTHLHLDGAGDNYAYLEVVDGFITANMTTDNQLMAVLFNSSFDMRKYSFYYQNGWGDAMRWQHNVDTIPINEDDFYYFTGLTAANSDFSTVVNDMDALTNNVPTIVNISGGCSMIQNNGILAECQTTDGSLSFNVTRVNSNQTQFYLFTDFGVNLTTGKNVYIYNSTIGIPDGDDFYIMVNSSGTFDGATRANINGSIADNRTDIFVNNNSVDSFTMLFTYDGNETLFINIRNSTIAVNDTTPPNVTFNSQQPPDITSSNVMANLLNLSYTITDNVDLNESDILLFLNVSDGSVLSKIHVNGTSIDITRQINYTAFFASIFNWSLDDGDVYPAVYNFDNEEMEETPHTFQRLDTNNELLKVRLFNVSNNVSFSFLELMVNGTGTIGKRIYYCNESYTSGNLDSSGSCVILSNLNGTAPFNHVHEGGISSHHLIPFNINTSTGTLSGIGVTSTSFIIMRGNPPSSPTDVFYISNVTRPDTTQSSGNNGVTWSNFAGTVDAHIHQFNITEGISYFACANDTSLNTGCSTSRIDLFNITVLPPSTPDVYSPTGTVNDTININYTESVPSIGLSISFYNISLVDENQNFVLTISSNNSLNLSFVWNTTEVTDGNYSIRVEAIDNISQSSFGFSSVIAIDNIPEIVVNITLDIEQTFCYNEDFLYIMEKDVSENGSAVFNEYLIQCDYGCSNVTLINLGLPGCEESPLFLVGVAFVFVIITVILVRWLF